MSFFFIFICGYGERFHICITLFSATVPFGTAGKALEDQLFLLPISSKLFSVWRQSQIGAVNKREILQERMALKSKENGSHRRKEVLH